MSKFTDMLNSKLPSQTSKIRQFSALYEGMNEFDDYGISQQDMEKDMETEGCGNSYRERCGDEGCSNSYRERCGDEGCSNGVCNEDDDYDDDIDGENDDDIEFDDSDLSAINSSEGDLDMNDIDDDEEVKDLGPDEKQKVADTLDVVATPLLLAQEFSLDQLETFTESADCDVAIEEGYLTEKTIVKLDKKAKLAKAYEVALFKIARSHNDKDYAKLETVWRMERKLKARLRKKYHIYAMKEAKDYIRRLQSSKSGIINKLAHKINK